MSKTNVIIIGAGGHLRSFLNLLDSNKYDITGIYDNSFKKENKEVIGKTPVRGTLADIITDQRIFLAIGDLDTKAQLITTFSSQLISHNLFHSKAIIEDHVFVNQRNHVFAGALINSYVSLGNDNIINSGAIIEHETTIGNNNHISIGAILGGRVSIGDNCFIGAGAVIIDKVSIGNHVTIGANSVVISSITEPGVYVGNPVKKIK